ncbi:polyunsaturated fatty acid lipoxygenase ALOX15B [Rhinophrynus dorsalis]
MYKYKIETSTKDIPNGGTIDSISIVLIGSRGESLETKLDNLFIEFATGSIDKFNISCKQDLGEILMIRLYKKSRLLYIPGTGDSWFCNYVNVTSPSGEVYEFPYYQWITGYATLEVQHGKGIILTDDISPLIKGQRKKELEEKKKSHRWKTYAPGCPRCIDADNVFDLSYNDQYTTKKIVNFGFTLLATGFEAKIKTFLFVNDSWRNLEDIKKVFFFKRTDNSDLVAQMWKEDSFFGYQFLNGINPVMIQKCFKIPKNFPVDDDMVSSYLGKSSLHDEIQDGNIFLVDYKILEGIPTNIINDQRQYIAAPMCLLWKSPQDHLIPIAIQLGQTPGKENPIFLPSDSEWDWTLAKMWVRSSEFHVHEVVTHLLFTHLFAEIFNIATTRNLPMGHPVYKLINPHLRYTLQINVLARLQLIGPGGLFDQAVATGNGGVPVLLKKAMESLTYTSLCLPDHIQARGVETIPNYYYRDDGMKIWLAIERFVSDIVNFHYTSDAAVFDDPELQAWVAEIYKEGFLESKASGIPSSFETRVELIKYLTMVIFTCSAQHAAVNSGQFDFYAWMPNGPSTMRNPPPTTKGTTTYQMILDTLPAINTTAIAMATVSLLSSEPGERRPLGNYSEKLFTEEMPQRFIKDFQIKLAEISRHIKQRNKSLNFTYPYMDPEQVENSVSI